MKKNIDIETVLRELYTVSGCRVSIHDSEYAEVAAYPHDLSPFCAMIQTNPAAYAECLRGDSEALSCVRRTEAPYIYRCHMGLYEAVAPLYHAGVLTGYLMMGQVADRSAGSKADIIERARRAMDGGDFTAAELGEAVTNLLTTNSERFSSFVNIMTICAEYITLSGRMDLPARDLAHMIRKYIHQNYSRHISLDALCENFRCSKSTLMNTFRAAYGTTVGRYLTEVRISRAERLLEDTERPVRDIAAECGFSDQGYFTKVFSAAHKVSPTEYRRRKRGTEEDGHDGQ